MPTVAILGTGAWSTANAVLLANKGIHVHLWGRRPDHVADLARDRTLRSLLPGVHLPETIKITSDPEQALTDVTHIAVGIPTQHIRKTLEPLKPHYPPNTPVLSLSKGVEIHTLLRPTEIIHQVFTDAPVASLSGPSHAEEVARGQPTSVVIASTDTNLARDFQSIWNTPLFRVYTNADLLGVEIAGATKNIIALAAGVCDGMGFGDNSKAALLTRGLAEIVRFGVAYGGKRETFFGLSGMGDIIVTGTSNLSRNWAMGNMIGKGLSLEEATESTEKIAEGVWTTEAIHDLANKLDVEMPITAEVHRVLFEGKSPGDGVRDLMTRSMKSEEESLGS